MTPEPQPWSSPRCCAVVVVDMQNDYCHEAGALARHGADVSAVPRVAEQTSSLLGAARDAGVPCIHVRTEHSEWTDTPAWTARGASGDLLDVAATPVAAVGTWGAEPYGVQADPADWVIVKHRYSAFAHTPLGLSLRARNRRTILLAGVTSDVCLRATAIDALALDVLPVLLRDCSASTSEHRHQDAVARFADSLGPVVDSSAVRAAFR